MRVVYDLLNSGDQVNENCDASVLFLPNSTSATRNPVTSKTSNHTDTSITTVSSDIPEASTTPRSSARIRTRKLEKDANSISNISINSSSKVSSAKTKTATNNRRVQCRAEEILNWLSGKGLVSEVVIRTAVGDTPDTSKALRLLLKKHEVIRIGIGGRPNPFLYKAVLKDAMQNRVNDGGID